MSRNRTEKDFTNDFGKTVPVNRKIRLSPINHRHEGLPSGVYLIGSIDLNTQEFCVEGGWHRMSDYGFGVVEPDCASMI